MRLSCRVKIVIDADVQRNVAAAQPDSAAIEQFGRLRLFREAEHADIEGARFGLAAARYCELNVIDAPKRRARV
jgi:hypothetical protein